MAYRYLNRQNDKILAVQLLSLFTTTSLAPCNTILITKQTPLLCSQVEFVEQKLGTGAMIASAKSGEVDVIIALTEGLVAGAAFLSSSWVGQRWRANPANIFFHQNIHFPSKIDTQDIACGSDLRLFGTYVQSPLCWAISTGRSSPMHSVEDLKGQVPPPTKGHRTRTERHTCPTALLPRVGPK